MPFNIFQSRGEGAHPSGVCPAHWSSGLSLGPALVPTQHGAWPREDFPPCLTWLDTRVRPHLPPSPWLLLTEVQHPVKILYGQYEKYLKADNMIRTTAICKLGHDKEVVVERDIILDNPALTLEVRGWEERLVPHRPPAPAALHKWQRTRLSLGLSLPNASAKGSMQARVFASCLER